MLSIRLPQELENRLATLAQQTGRTKTFYVREAIERYIEDMEDVYLALAVLENVSAGKEEVISSEDMWDGLDD